VTPRPTSSSSDVDCTTSECICMKFSGKVGTETMKKQGGICRGKPGIFPVTGFHVPPCGSKSTIPTREAYFPHYWFLIHGRNWMLQITSRAFVPKLVSEIKTQNNKIRYWIYSQPSIDTR